MGSISHHVLVFLLDILRYFTNLMGKQKQFGFGTNICLKSVHMKDQHKVMFHEKNMNRHLPMILIHELDNKSNSK